MNENVFSLRHSKQKTDNDNVYVMKKLFQPPLYRNKQTASSNLRVHYTVTTCNEQQIKRKMPALFEMQNSNTHVQCEA